MVPGDPAPAGRRHQRRLVEALFADLHAACEELEVVLVGGHTEVTHGLDRPIVAGTMLGEVDKDKLVTTAGARVGDAVVMTKGVPLEGAAIIAREKEAELRERGVSPAVIRRAKGFLKNPGLSVLPEAEIACELATVHSMHDPTEGGIATALVELAGAAGSGSASTATASWCSRKVGALRGLRARSARHHRVGRAPDDVGTGRRRDRDPCARARIHRLSLQSARSCRASRA